MRDRPNDRKGPFTAGDVASGGFARFIEARPDAGNVIANLEGHAVRAPDVAVAFDALLRDAAVPAVAIGETGLDYYYTHSPPETQRAVCIAQIRYASARNLPIIFHQRDAYADFRAILREEFKPRQRGVVHCFTGDAAQARTFVEEFGLVLGIGGVVTFKTADDVRAAAALCPLDRLLVETDAPFLAPLPHRGKRNEPAWVGRVAEKVAEVCAVTAEQVASSTANNFFRFFGVAPDAES